MQTGVAEISLAAAQVPATRTLHKIIFRARTTSGTGGKIRVELYEGTTNRSGLMEATVTTQFVTYTLTLTDPSAASITDYSNLTIHLWGYHPDTALTFQVTEIYMTLPAASSAVTQNGSVTVGRNFSFATNGTVVAGTHSTGVAQISLSTAADPGIDTGHSIVVRARAPSGTGQLNVALYEGASNRSGNLQTGNLTTSFADYTLAIPQANAANITSYANLEVRLWGTSAGTATFDVSRVSLQLPPGGSSTTVVVGIASGGNSAIPLVIIQGVPVVYPGTGVYPSDTLFPGFINVDIAEEFNVALPVSSTGQAIAISIGLAEEFDTSTTATLPQPNAVIVNIATETDQAFVLGVLGGAAAVTVGIATERAITGLVTGSGDLITRSVIMDGSQDLVIGSRVDGTTYSGKLQASLDELALLGGPISDEEVRDLYLRAIHSGTDTVSYDSTTGIWAGATNLVPNGGFEAGANGWNVVGSAMLSSEATEVLLGAKALKITGSTGEGANTNSIVTTVSQTYTASVWVKGNGVFRMELEERTAADAFVAMTNGGDLSLDGTYRRISVTRTFGGTGARARVRLIARSTGATIYADGVQLELGSIMTPYVDTNGVTATRQAARVQVPSSYLDEAQGWVAMRIRPGWSNAAEPGDAYVVDWRTDSNHRISVFYEASSNSFVVRRTDNLSPAQATVARAVAARDRVTVIAAWTSAGVKLSVDGAAFVSVNGTGVPALAVNATTFDLGSIGGTSNFWDGEFLWFACGKGTLTDANALYLHQWADEPPRLHTYPAAALVNLGWDAVDDHALEAGFTHSLVKGQLRRIFHSPGAKRSTTDMELIDSMERLSTESGLLDSDGPEFMGEAISRILERIGLEDPSLQDLDPGEPGIIATNDGTHTWLQQITDIVLSDGGIFFLDGDGRAVFRERRARVLAPYVGRLSRELHALAPGVDLDRIINVWAITPGAYPVAEGAEAPAALASYSRSYRRYKIRASAFTAPHLSTLDQAYSLGEHMVRRTSEPDAPIYGLSISNRSDRLLAFCLQLEVGDLISVFGKKTIGYYIVEQISVDVNVSDGKHETSLVVSAL